MTQDIEKLIVKYLNNAATASDLDTLSQWIEKPANKLVFKDYVQIHVAINHNMNNPETKKAVDQFLSTIRKEKSLVYKIKKQPIYKYVAAASIILMVALTVFLNKEDDAPQFTEPIIVNNQIKTGTDKAILKLESGEEITLEKGTNYQTTNAISNGEEIIYEAGKSNKVEIAYNTLTIPRGGQFYIVLSDGTKIWLNSESQIKYPVTFIKGQTRQVELVYGEAYFDVSPSINHKGSDFKVFHKAQEVQVLGTEFNINAYKDETSIYTTLVEGKVVVNYVGENQILAPTQQSNLDVKNSTIAINTVDIYKETSWKEGVFSFSRKPLKDIMKVLTRWYDMEVVFISKELESVGFTGTFNKNRSIEEILIAIRSTNSINSYEINNKELIIK